MKKKILVLFLLIFMCSSCKEKELIMPNFYDKNINEVIEFCENNNLSYEIKEVNDDEIIKDNIIWQNIEENEKLEESSIIIVTKSLGKDMIKEYIKYNVDESGNVPIMMYHGISNLKDSDTGYTGGNVDKDGYTRTTESFRRDLDFYYQNNYRMIRLDDYIHGIIDVELGKSPIILTFDDGNSNNMKVLGKDDKGNLIIDPNSAVGILEEYKKKYPDFNITATFFINSSLFNQPDYNEDILNWLIDNGYDIGNHTINHPDFTKLNEDQAVIEVGKMYKILNDYLGERYVNIVALPFGSPYDSDHKTFPAILEGNYEGFEYITESTLRVGWEADYSPFNINFNPQFLKRIRAYDNNGVEFDIKMNFDILKNNRYISDGDASTIVVPNNRKDKISDRYDKEIIYYDIES